MKTIVIYFLLCLSSLVAQSQTRYWIFLKDKDTTNYDYRQHLSPEALKNREQLGLPLRQFTDIPLSTAYIRSLKNEGVKPQNLSKWLNAVAADLSAEQVQKIKKLPFVAGLRVIPRGMVANRMVGSRSDDKKEYGLALQAMEGEAFAEAGLNGKNVAIGVIDAGFYGAKNSFYLEHLFAENRIRMVRDMLNPAKKDHYNQQETSSDDHGTEVLEMITGYQPNKKQYGLATEAVFYLARTDHGDKETRAEEDYWVVSLEWLDSLGVRLVNTSLGYSTGFDLEDENYTPAQMDGKSSVVSRAAQIAYEQKGMIIVVSAGNEGSDASWEIVSAPADAAGVLSVGALSSNGVKAFYSSIGSEELPYLKPDVVCIAQTSSGTSFTAPVVTGFVACLLQKNPYLPNHEAFRIIKQSGNLYPFGNNYVGYGTPKARQALQLLAGEKLDITHKKEIKIKGESYILKTKKTSGKAHIFYKKNQTIVLDKDFINLKRKQIILKKTKKVKRATVVVDDMVWEIIWE